MTIYDVVIASSATPGELAGEDARLLGFAIILSLCLVVIFPIAVVIVRVTFVPVVTIVFVINAATMFVYSYDASRSCQQCQ
jgi:hypothetical protein